MMNESTSRDFFVHSTLLEGLKAIYPAVYPDPDKSEKEQLYKAGQHSVVQYLQRIYDQQEDGDVYSGSS